MGERADSDRKVGSNDLIKRPNRRPSHRASGALAAFAIAAVLAIVALRWLHIHSDAANLEQSLYGLAAVCLPTLFALVLAFKSDVKNSHWLWQLAVVALGVCGSFVTWQEKQLEFAAFGRPHRR